MSILTISEEKLKQWGYELYKLDWLNTHVPLEEQLAEYRCYLLEKEMNLAEEYSFEEYLVDNGYGGSLYVCFEEFLGAEFQDDEYMKHLLSENSVFWKAYMDFKGDGDGNKEEINPEDYTIECCPWCDSEQVIFSKGVTACPECGKPLAPCSVCEECDYNTCPYGCTGGEEDAFKKVTNPPISKGLVVKLYKLL